MNDLLFVGCFMPLYVYHDSFQIYLVVTPIITFVGLICNCLMLVTMRSQSMRSTPLAVYMSALACADSVILILDFLNNWVYFVSDYRFNTISDGVCKAFIFVFGGTFTYCGWLVVAIAAERMIIVWFPMKAKSLCTTRKALIVVITMAVACGAFSTVNIVIWSVSGIEDSRCAISDDYKQLNQQVIVWLR